MGTIAFIGIGIMGGPVTDNLAKTGHTVIGFIEARSRWRS